MRIIPKKIKVKNTVWKCYSTVRRLVEYIRVMSDGRIIVVLKGGMSIEEPIEEKSE